MSLLYTPSTDPSADLSSAASREQGASAVPHSDFVKSLSLALTLAPRLAARPAVPHAAPRERAPSSAAGHLMSNVAAPSSAPALAALPPPSTRARRACAGPAGMMQQPRER